MRGLTLEMPAADLIREHTVEPHSWFGLCPASNQEDPVKPEVAEHLHKAELALLAMLEQQQPPATVTTTTQAAPAAPPARWFRNSERGDPRERGPLARPKLTVLPEKGPMPTTAEVRAAIDAASTDIAEGMELARQAQEKMETAKVKLMWVKETTVDPLGVPQVSAAADGLETVQQLAHIAIENNQTYASNL